MHYTAGFSLAKPAEVLGAEPYVHELIAGIERVLVPRGGSLLLRIVPNVAEVATTIRRWSQDGNVDAVLLIDLEPGDPLVSLVHELGMPAVVSGDPATAGALQAVWSQDELAMRTAVEVMLALGHTSLAHVTGPARMAHTRLRMAAFEQLSTQGGAVTMTLEGDYSERSGREITLALLQEESPPTAIIADNDLMAIGALKAARESGVRVPEDLSILAWDDSPLCQLSAPPLSAMSHDVQAIGELIAHALLSAKVDSEPSPIHAPRAEFVARGSTGGAPDLKQPQKEET